MGFFDTIVRTISHPVDSVFGKSYKDKAQSAFIGLLLKVTDDIILDSDNLSEPLTRKLILISSQWREFSGYLDTFYRKVDYDNYELIKEFILIETAIKSVIARYLKTSETYESGKPQRPTSEQLTTFKKAADELIYSTVGQRLQDLAEELNTNPDTFLKEALALIDNPKNKMGTTRGQNASIAIIQGKSRDPSQTKEFKLLYDYMAIIFKTIDNLTSNIIKRA